MPKGVFLAKKYSNCYKYFCTGLACTLEGPFCFFFNYKIKVN